MLETSKEAEDGSRRIVNDDSVTIQVRWWHQTGLAGVLRHGQTLTTLCGGEPAISADRLESSVNGREDFRMTAGIWDLSKWKDGTVVNGDGKMAGEAIWGRLLK